MKKCFPNVHKEMVWDATFVTKKLWKSHWRHSQNTFTTPKLFKTLKPQTWLTQIFHPKPFPCQNCDLIFKSNKNDFRGANGVTVIDLDMGDACTLGA